MKIENMIFPDNTLQLMYCFPGSFINDQGELILIPRTNLYILTRQKSELGLIASILEYCSRDASKNRDARYRDTVLNGMNKFLGTDFGQSDMELIYKVLGNGINSNLTKRFIDSQYDLSLLAEV